MSDSKKSDQKGNTGNQDKGYGEKILDRIKDRETENVDRTRTENPDSTKRNL